MEKIHIETRVLQWNSINSKTGKLLLNIFFAHFSNKRRMIENVVLRNNINNNIKYNDEFTYLLKYLQKRKY